MNDETVLLERSMAPTLADVRGVRQDVRAALVGAGAGTDLAADAELVASELLTNAVEQRPDGDVHVVVLRRATHVVLVVTNPTGEDHLPPVESWPSLTDAAGARGRGLPIVAALTERLEIDQDADVTSIACWWRVVADDEVRPG
ncbi:MAG: ATP-binding protein [Actinomycetota bacterium]